LIAQDIEGAIVPDDVIGEVQFRANRELSSESLLDLGVGPTTLTQPVGLDALGASDADCGVEFGGGVGFEQERDDNDGATFFFGAPLLRLRAPDVSNARMEDLFQLVTGGLVVEHDVRELISQQLSVWTDQGRTEGEPNLVECGFAGLHQFTRDTVGIGDGDAILREELGGCGFTHADTTGETEEFQGERLAVERGIRVSGFDGAIEACFLLASLGIEDLDDAVDGDFGGDGRPRFEIR
jgi:hypothetical protein